MALPFFSRSSVNFLLGPLFSRKTWLALDLAVSLAAGYRWPTETPDPVMSTADVMRFPSAEPGESLLGASRVDSPDRRSVATPVLFIDEYHGLDELSRRLRTLFRARRVPRNIPFHFMSLPRYNLADPLDAASLQAEARSVKAGLIVLDNPSQFGSGERAFPISNATGAFPIANLHRLAESLNAAILVLLHTRTRHVRSSLASALSALGTDHILALDFYPTDRPQKATSRNKLLPRCESGYLHLRTITVANSLPPIEGGGDGGRGLSLHLRIRATNHHFSLSPLSQTPDYQAIRLTDFQPALGPASLHILSFLAARGEASTRQLVTATKNSASYGWRLHLINNLVKDGFLRRTNPGSKGVPALFAITPSGRSLVNVER